MSTVNQNIPSNLKNILTRYHGANHRKAWWEILSAFIPFVLGWFLMVWSLQYPYPVTLLLAIVPSVFLLRIFSIQHDCGHYSFFASKRSNDILGVICSLLTLTPYHYWLRSHAYHHTHVCNLDFQKTGYVKLKSVAEFLSSTPTEKLLYRIYRSPLVLFFFGPPLQFLILQRLTYRIAPSWTKERRWVHFTNGLILLISLPVVLAIGWQNFLLVELPIVWITACLGVWLFYVQHTFEETYFSGDETWDWLKSSLEGSSHYDLPVLLHFFSGNTGFHHIHHLDSLIPNYSLRDCYHENPDLQIGRKVSLLQSLQSISLSLWDESQQKLVSFEEVTP
jgi:omega-6 fatty acid desaturase (delta-12 desaturase)